MTLNYHALRVVQATFISFLMFTSACQWIPTEAESTCSGCGQAFEVHLNNNFDQDRVRVEIDGDVVIDARVTTNYVLSLAEVIELERPEGIHKIRVVVNDSEEGRKTFELDGQLFIHVRYFPEAILDLNIPEGVMIEVTRNRPMYD